MDWGPFDDIAKVLNNKRPLGPRPRCFKHSSSSLSKWPANKRFYFEICHKRSISTNITFFGQVQDLTQPSKLHTHFFSPWANECRMSTFRIQPDNGKRNPIARKISPENQWPENISDLTFLQYFANAGQRNSEKLWRRIVIFHRLMKGNNEVSNLLAITVNSLSGSHTAAAAVLQPMP